MKILAGMLLLAVVAAAPVAADGVHVRLETPVLAVSPNDEFDVDVVVFEADEPFNAFDASIRFDPAKLSYLAGSNQQGALMTAACANRFHLFTPTPDSLKITLSLLCAGTTVTGPGVIYKVRMKAGATSGLTTISLGPFTNFYNAGFFVTPLETQSRQVCILPCSGVGVDDEVGATRFALLAPRPNPWSGSGPESFEFDLPAEDQVTLTLHDVSGRVIATHGPQWFGAGRHAIALARPQAPTGVYFARLHTAHGTASRTVVLTR